MNTTALDREFVVFGLGKTGLSCARYLSARNESFAVIDTRDKPPGLAQFSAEYPDVPVLTGAVAPEVIGRCGQLLLSPGIARTHPIVAAALARGIDVIGDIELFAGNATAPIIAVTGSNGKSTVVTLVAEILKHAGRDVRTGGNLGTPALDLLGDDEPDCYVLELSSFQLESVRSLAPAAACILNVSPDHMDRYASFSDYVAAKARILERAEISILNIDDEASRALHSNAEVRYFGTADRGAAEYTVERDGDRSWLVVGGQRFMAADELGLRGTHNILNVLAALALTDVMAVPGEHQRAVLREFRGLPHRAQLVAQHAGVDWIDDSKGTNVGASCAAIAGVFAARGGVLIAGGQGKGADFSALGRALEGRVHAAVLIGEDAPAIAAAIGPEVAVHFALDMDSAVMAAGALAREGEAVLLSPACASFDMFENFEARGRAFADAVARMIIA